MDHAVGVVAITQGQGFGIGATVGVTLAATVLRICKEDITKSPAAEISEIMQGPLDSSDSRGAMATFWARLALIVLAFIYDFGFGQIFNALYPWQILRFVLSWAIHSHILPNNCCLEEYRHLWQICLICPLQR